MRVQFASDLHLNTWSQQLKEKPVFEQLLEPVAKTLVLAGDIGNPESMILQIFLTWCSKKWDLVFWIPGHHEMTDAWHLKTRSYDACLHHMRLLANQHKNIKVLHRDSFVTSDGFLFLGCPLWARLSSMSEEMSRDPIMKEITRRHEEDLAWLKSQLRLATKPVVIATHYPPTYTLMDKRYFNKQLSVPYALETEGLLRPPVVAWICGYMHKSAILQKPYIDSEGRDGQVLIVINPRGYPDDEETGYRTEAVLSLTDVAASSRISQTPAQTSQSSQTGKKRQVSFAS